MYTFLHFLNNVHIVGANTLLLKKNYKVLSSIARIMYTVSILCKLNSKYITPYFHIDEMFVYERTVQNSFHL